MFIAVGHSEAPDARRARQDISEQCAPAGMLATFHDLGLLGEKR